MKKLYSLLVLLAFSAGAYAQCTVSFTYTTSGMTINVNATGVGAVVPYYAWSFGDAGTGTGASTSHTYTAAGTYSVCVIYADATDTSCYAYSCQNVTITASGIAVNSAPQFSVQATPNPFTTSTSINLTLDQSADVQVGIYDITGQKVAVMQDGKMSAGTHTLQWKPENLAEGIYFLRVEADGIIQTRKLVYTTN